MKTNDKIKQMEEILVGPWVTSEFVDNKVLLKGATKSDIIEIKLSDVSLLAKFLDHTNSMVRCETVKILALFGESANTYVNKFTDYFFDYEWEQQRDIIDSLAKIKTRDVLTVYGELVDKMQEPIQGLSKLIFHVSEYMEQFPAEGLEIISKISKFKIVWKMYKQIIQEALATATLPEEAYLEKIEQERLHPPPIGMSQEQEKRRLEHSITKMHIQNAIKNLLDQEKSKDMKNKKAKQILKILKKKIK